MSWEMRIMQLKTSFFNRTMIKKNVARSWIAGVLWFAWIFYRYPLGFLLVIWDKSAESAVQYGKGYALLQSLTTTGMFSDALIASVLAIAVVMLNFSYLFKKRDCYMIHSFPVGRKSLFFSGLTSTLLVMLLPVLLNGIFMGILAVGTGAGYLRMVGISSAILLISVIIFVGMSVFTIMISGQAVTTLVFYLIFNFLFEMIRSVLITAVNTLMFGMGESSEFTFLSILSPVSYLSDMSIEIDVDWSKDGEQITKLSTAFTDGKVLLFYLILGIFLMIAAYFLYQHKKLETVNDFITVPFMKWVFSFGASFFISLSAAIFVVSTLKTSFNFNYNSYFAVAIVLTVICGFFVFFLSQMLIEKNIWVLKKEKMLAWAGYTVVAFLFLLSFRFDFWNMEDYIPDASQIEWAGYQDRYTQIYTDADNIAKFIQLHKAILKDKKEMSDMAFYNGASEDVQNIAFRYKLKNGKTIIRYYFFVNPKQEEFSDSYSEITESFLALANDPENIKEHVVGNIWNTCEVIHADFVKNEADSATGDDPVYSIEDSTETVIDSADESASSSNASYGYGQNSSEAYQAIYEALLKDIDEGNIYQESFASYDDSGDELTLTMKNTGKEKYYADSDRFYAQNLNDLDYSVINIFATITDNCSNTKAALEKYGFYDNADTNS